MSDYENRSLDEMAYELDHWPTEDTTMEIAREFLRRLRHAEAVLSACEKEKRKTRTIYPRFQCRRRFYKAPLQKSKIILQATYASGPFFIVKTKPSGVGKKS